MIPNNIDKNSEELPGRNQLYVFGLLSAAWVAVVYLNPKGGGLFGYMDTVIGLALICIWTGVFYQFIAKDIDRRETLERLARDLQHQEVRYQLYEFGPIRMVLENEEFRSYREPGLNLTLVLFIALAAVSILYLLS